MKISAINTQTYKMPYLANTNNKNFKGILKLQDHKHDSNSWHGSPSSYNIDGNYSTDDDYYKYTYHPFKNETEQEIKKNIDENNNCHHNDCCGVFMTTHNETTRGKTIPYTKQEWERLPKTIKEKFMEIL